MLEIDGHEAEFDIVHYDPKPGDVVVHHLRNVHCAGANQSLNQNRRTIAIRYGGDDATYKFRRFAPPDGTEVDLKDGEPLSHCPDEFPPVWPRGNAAKATSG